MCWNASVLGLIVSAAGHFVKMDESTSLMMKGRFAHVTIEVDIAHPFVPRIDVVLDVVDAQTFWQRFEYVHVHLFVLVVVVLVTSPLIVTPLHPLQQRFLFQLNLTAHLSRRRMLLWRLTIPTNRPMVNN